MALTNVVAAQTVYQQTAPNEYLFPGLCRKQNGDYLMVARKASGHLAGDGKLITMTSATGLAGAWSSETIIFSPGNAVAGLPRLLADGRVALMAWYALGPYPPFITTTFISTDATCTAWVRGGNLPDQFGGGAAWGGNACECPIIVRPDGKWWLATYGPEASGDCSWSSALYESDDEGISWTFLRYIARAPVPTPRFGTPNYEEPFLLHIGGSEYLCAVRCGESGWNGTVGRYTHIFRTVDDGLTWADEGRLNSTHQHASRMALCRNPLTGTIMLHHRLLYLSSGYSWSGRGAYYWSDDDGHTWSAGKELDGDGAPPSNPTSPPMHSYGDIVALPNGFAALWADETPISGSGSAIRFAAYTDDAAPLAPGLTIDPANTAWEQDETQLTVQAGHNARSITEATVESLSGGTLVYSGGDSAKFSVSLNGTTWTPTVTVPAGTTVIYLSVLPDSDDTTLTTSVGVPI